MAEGEAAGVEEALEVGAHDARLDGGRGRVLIDTERPAQLRQVDGDRGSVAGWLDAADDGRAAAERDDGQSVATGEPQDLQHVLLRRRRNDNVGRTRHLAPADANQVLVPLAQAEDGAGGVVGRHSLSADDGGQLRDDAFGHAAGRHADRGRRIQTLGRLALAQAVAHVGPETIAVRQMVGLVLASPAPPFGSHY